MAANKDAISFDSPRQLIKWAEDDLQRTVVLWQAFGRENPQQFTAEQGVDGWTNVYIEMPGKLPSEINKLAHSISTNIKHTFDQSFHALVKKISSTVKGDAHFPWRQNPADFTRYIERFALDEVYVSFLLEEIQPYWSGEGYDGGDDLLRDFAYDLNKHKHQIVAGIDAHANANDIKIVALEAGKVTVRVPTSSRRVGENKILLACSIGPTGHRLEIETMTYLSFKGGRLDRQPLHPTLRYCLSKARVVTDIFEIFSNN